ncbi:CapA family protein [Patescibacteria group bacterium]
MEFKAAGKLKISFTWKRFLLMLFVVFVVLTYFSVLLCYSQKSKLNKEVFYNPIPTATEKVPENISLFIAGDVMLGRTVMGKSYELDDFSYPFRKVSDVMRESDITFVNLENPIVESCPFREIGLIFCATQEMLDGLTFSGVDVVNLANNHTLNYGRSGLNETLEYLKAKNILVTGVEYLITLKRNGVVFGFLGFDKSEQVNPKLTQDEVDLIVSSDKKVDILVVSMHWGVEYQDKALPGVRSLAKDIVGYGADLIVGHHPHWVQDWEYIESKPVFYSLGNFVFDQMWSERTKKGLAVMLTYDSEGNLTDYELLSTYMSSWSQPEFVSN